MISQRCSAKRTIASAFPRKRTLQIAQALYETPQNDHLSADRFARACRRITSPSCPANVRQPAGDLAQARPEGSRKRLGASEQAHFQQRANLAITSPSSRPPPKPKHLDEMEAKVYDMIARRFVAAFFPAAEFDITTRLSQVRRARVQDGRQSADRARLAGGLWQDHGRWIPTRAKRCRP